MLMLMHAFQVAIFLMDCTPSCLLHMFQIVMQSILSALSCCQLRICSRNNLPPSIHRFTTVYLWSTHSVLQAFNLVCRLAVANS